MKLNILLSIFVTAIFFGALYVANKASGKISKCRMSCSPNLFHVIDGRCYCITNSALAEVK